MLHHTLLLLVLLASGLSVNPHLYPNETLSDPASNQLIDFKKAHKGGGVLTTGWGSPVDDRGNVLTAGPRGPVLLQDVPFVEELQMFNRERLAPRVVHAKGGGAFGYFTVTDDITRYCKASIFSKIGQKTPMAARFSPILSEAGSPDTNRDVRGFALKFYTKDGIWDMVGNHSPAFALRDPYRFISLIHASKRNPRTNLVDLNALWDFFSLHPETLHHILILYTDVGTPDGFRYIHGFGVNTFKLVNAKDDVFYCKLHYKSDQGLRTLTAARAKELAAEDTDYAVRDLYNAIATGDFPSWTMYIQVLTPEEAANFPWNILDPTKIWPENMVPLIRVGKFILNRNQNNFFAEIEQAAYNPGRLVPGIESTTDKILQSRLFAYNDNQLHRLGTNYLQIPVNSPHHVFNTQRDGEACYTDNQDGQPNYYPSSFIDQMNSPRARIHPYPTHGKVDRYNSTDEDNFSQPRMLWRSYTDDVRRTLVHNIANDLHRVALFIQKRAIKNFMEVDTNLGNLIQSALDSRSKSAESADILEQVTV